MKAVISSLANSKNLNLHHSSSAVSRSTILQPKSFSRRPSFLSPIPTKTQSNFGLNRKNRIQTTNFPSIMASSYKPEQARSPPALPLPTPPITKARFFYLGALLYQIFELGLLGLDG